MVADAVGREVRVTVGVFNGVRVIKGVAVGCGVLVAGSRSAMEQA